MNKKGQLPATLTWVVATTIIFFMIILFLILASYMSSLKRMPVVGSYSENGKNEISLTGESVAAEDCTAGDDLYSFLNSMGFENKRSIDFLEEYYINSDEDSFLKFEKYALRYFNQTYDSCFYLCITFYGDGNTKKEKRIDGEKCGLIKRSCSELVNNENYLSSEVNKEYSHDGKKIKMAISLHKGAVDKYE